MTTFDPNDFGPELAEVLPDRLMPLAEGSPNSAFRSPIRALADLSFFPRPVVDREAAQACVSGIWLYHDFLDESHEVSQKIHTPEGSYWHAIMHRREPDYPNSKYWFRQTGDHPVFGELAEKANGLGLSVGNSWNAFDFVDLCEKHAGTGSDKEMVLRRVQQREWELLFSWCYHKALGQKG